MTAILDSLAGMPMVAWAASFLGGAAIAWVVAWLMFDVIPSHQHFGTRVRWGAPQSDWMVPPHATRRKEKTYALALVEYRSWFSLRRRLVYIPPLHTLLIGPSGSGKSTSLMSALLTWEGGALVLDPKGEFYETTAGWRLRELKQAILCWDIRDGKATGGGLPIEAMYGSRDNAIDQLASLIIGEDAKQAPFVYPWIAIIKALLADATVRGLPPWQTAMAIPSSQWESALEQIARTPDHPGRAHAQEALGKRAAPEYFASIAGTADQVAPVLRAIAALLDAGIGKPVPNMAASTIYVILPTNPLPGEKLALRWIFAGAQQYVSRRDPLPPPGCVWIIDEAGALRPDGLADWVRFMRGKRVAVIIATQNVNDLNAAYGQDNAASIIGSMNGPHIFIGWRQMSEATVNLLAQSLASYTTTRRRTGDRYETMPGDVADARRMVARLKHGVMFGRTGGDRPCPVYPAPYYRWFKNRQLPQPSDEEILAALAAMEGTLERGATKEEPAPASARASAHIAANGHVGRDAGSATAAAPPGALPPTGTHERAAGMEAASRRDRERESKGDVVGPQRTTHGPEAGLFRDDGRPGVAFADGNASRRADRVRERAADDASSNASQTHAFADQGASARASDDPLAGLWTTILESIRQAEESNSGASQASHPSSSTRKREGEDASMDFSWIVPDAHDEDEQLDADDDAWEEIIHADKETVRSLLPFPDWMVALPSHA